MRVLTDAKEGHHHSPSTLWFVILAVCSAINSGMIKLSISKPSVTVPPCKSTGVSSFFLPSALPTNSSIPDMLFDLLDLGTLIHLSPSPLMMNTTSHFLVVNKFPMTRSCPYLSRACSALETSRLGSVSSLKLTIMLSRGAHDETSLDRNLGTGSRLMTSWFPVPWILCSSSLSRGMKKSETAAAR